VTLFFSLFFFGGLRFVYFEIAAEAAAMEAG
jgi:hypothetical protein